MVSDGRGGGDEATLQITDGSLLASQGRSIGFVAVGAYCLNFCIEFYVWSHYLKTSDAHTVSHLHCLRRSKDNMQNTAVLLDMGEYLYCPPGQQLPLALEAKDLQQPLGAASGAMVTGLPRTTEAKLKAGIAAAPPSPQPLPLKGRPALSGSSGGTSRLRFESLPEAGPTASKLSPAASSSLSSTMVTSTASHRRLWAAFPHRGSSCRR